MAYTYDELKEKTVAELREIASGVQHEAVQGYTQLNKEQLLPALCKALGIDMHGHHQVIGIDKTAVKRKIRELRKQRDEIMASKERARLLPVLRRIHDLKRHIRRAIV